MTNLFERYPMSGQLINVGGHHLHLHCQGESEPTVIFESGMAGFSMDWMLVQPEVARFARTCVYDRAGTGWSEAGPHPRTPEQAVTELHTLLHTAGIPGPYILVAHSLGGRYARLFADHYPDEVAGLVLVDPDQEGYGERLGAEKYQDYVDLRSRQYAMLDTLFGALKRLGLAGCFGKSLLGMLLPELRSAPAAVRQQYADIAVRPGALKIAIEEYQQAVAADADLKAARMPSHIPLVVLAHGVPWPYQEYEQAWQEGLKQVAALSPLGELVIAENSGHAIMLAQPELVVGAVRRMVERVRV